MGKTFISIAIDDDTFRVQLVVTRNILFPVVFGTGFLKRHGGIISFPTNQLYLTKPSPKPADPPINADHIYNTYTPPIHMPNTYHSSSCLTVHANPTYHILYTEPVTIPGRANTVTIPCALPRSGNSFFELSKKHFADQPVESTPVIINAENENLPVRFTRHSDDEVLTPKHSYVGAMEEAQESNQDILTTNTSPEIVSQHVLSKCLAHSDLLPEITPPPKNKSTETSPNSNPGSKNLFTGPPATADTVLVAGILPTNSRNTTTDRVDDFSEINPLPDLTESLRRQQKIQCIDNPLDTTTLPDCVTIPNVDNQLDINTLPNRVTNMKNKGLILRLKKKHLLTIILYLIA